MNDLPRKTAEKLSEVHQPGTRHNAALAIALPLLGNGMSSDQVLLVLREKFSPGVSDKELENIVRWAKPRALPAPGSTAQPNREYQRYYPAPAEPKPKPPAEHAAWWLSGQTMTPEQFTQLSQLPIPDGPRAALTSALELLYVGTDNINILGQFIEEGGKAKPFGPGRTMTRDKWCEYVRDKGVPETRAGEWFRPNPCNPAGSGAGGAVTDSDVVCWRFLLLESDVLPLEVQLALFSRLKLPIAMVTLSGGHSAHALVKVEANNANEFSETGRRILTALASFGIDPANKNPSRLSRLPCARRVIGAEGTGLQSLLWLNPGKAAVTEDELTAFEESLLLPALQEKPFKQVVVDAIERYEYLFENRGKLGIKTGLPKLDAAMGGWKPGTMTILCAETGVGKTTLAVNWIDAALREGQGVVLFSMEMSREDICDMLFSLRCRIDRNKFNTGEFTKPDLEAMALGGPDMQRLPLWIEDAATISLSFIRRRTLQLAADSRIGLAVVDYAQLVEPENRGDQREQQVAQVGRGLRVLAKDSKLPFIVLSQVNDDGMLRESRVLGHEAANVFRISKKKGVLTLRIDKGRKIPSDPVPLHFDATFCRIGEATGHEIEPQDVPEPTQPYPD
jgi:hypothetical protein